MPVPNDTTVVVVVGGTVVGALVVVGGAVVVDVPVDELDWAEPVGVLTPSESDPPHAVRSDAPAVTRSAKVASRRVTRAA